jgi:hypothetical protein
VLIVSINIFKGFSDPSGLSFIPQPSFRDRGWIVYGTLVVPRHRISVESAVVSGEENAFASCAEDSARYSPQFSGCMFAIWIIAKTIVAKKITANAAQKIAENITRPTRCGGRSSG